ncbi:hypothetical protein D0Z03_000737 [Geotrichum reessii]|nr:hypothetical protein D0Z03_000737 [Galactomyces reessii]
MLFGVRLASQIYPPWKEEYIAYDKLKKLLKESIVPHGTKQDDWSEADETNFVSVLDSELEKVYSFQSKTYSMLSDKISEIEKSINQAESFKVEDAKSFEAKLEEILEAARELDTFSRLNFTGFTKIVKKHDRLHSKYQVKPLLQVRLAALPFHSEDYSPLLYRLSVLYAFLSENFGANSTPAGLSSVIAGENADYTTYKFWVHPENVMEVKTRILRHLPLLIYGSNTSGTGEDDEEAGEPTISSLYFDNPNLELYESKLQKSEVSPSLRLRWVGRLSEKPEITLEKKVVDHTATGEYIPDEKLPIKEKYIQPFLEGKYSMEKTIKKMKERGTTDQSIEAYKKSVNNIQTFIQEHDLSPVMRTMYTRSAFQIPGDNRVRAILDSNIVFIREDSFDESRPVRDPENWHRSDIDAPGIEKPLSMLRKGEFSKFPFAVLEFRVLTKSLSDNKGKTPSSIGPNATVPAIKRHGKWIQELTNSHLVKEVPKFSKFIQGIASLFAEDDRLDALPFWVNDLEHDIRQDPKQAWEDQKRRLKEAATIAQESNKIRLRTSSGTRLTQSPLFSALEDSSVRPQSSSSVEGSSTALVEESVADEGENDDADIDDDDSTDDGETDISSEALRKQKSKSLKSRIRNLSFLPNQGPRLNMDSEDEEIVLPPGVVKPSLLIRNSGPVKVETKVWLANERTFNKWLHITTLLSALTFTLYSSVGRSSSQQTAEYVAYILFALTVFSGLWGYGTYMQRLKYIKARSERHLDNPIGPIIIALGLLAALIVNFLSNYKIHHGDNHGLQPNATVVF